MPRAPVMGLRLWLMTSLLSLALIACASFEQFHRNTLAATRFVCEVLPPPPPKVESDARDADASAPTDAPTMPLPELLTQHAKALRSRGAS